MAVIKTCLTVVAVLVTVGITYWVLNEEPHPPDKRLKRAVTTATAPTVNKNKSVATTPFPTMNTINFTSTPGNQTTTVKTSTTTHAPTPPQTAGTTSTFSSGQDQQAKETGCERYRDTAEKDILPSIQKLRNQSKVLVKNRLPNYVQSLNQTVELEKMEIYQSAPTILAIVDILKKIAQVSSGVTKPVMKTVLTTVEVIVSKEANPSWFTLNKKKCNVSSGLLGALEGLTKALQGEMSFSTKWFLLQRFRFDNPFKKQLSNCVAIKIPRTHLSNVYITTITVSFPTRVFAWDKKNYMIHKFYSAYISSKVVLISVDKPINKNLSIIFKEKYCSPDPKCVFLNFSLYSGFWDEKGCELVSHIDKAMICSCNHVATRLTIIIDYILVGVGVGVSVLCSLICLIIEGCVWRTITTNSSALIRHVSIINTAVCLIIRDLCFMAQVLFFNEVREYSEMDKPCTIVTFVRHFFDLALFFWMLVSCLLLFYRTTMVFSNMSKSKMLSIGFSLGYGVPLLIASITFAATAPRDVYLGKDYCWLNLNESYTLLALVIPAFFVVSINIILLSVVLFNIVRSGRVTTTVQNNQQHKLVVRLVFLLVSFLLFGLTCGLSLGTLHAPKNLRVYISFAVFNSLQGLWILVFGTLYDAKIRLILFRKCCRIRAPDTQHGKSFTLNAWPWARDNCQGSNQNSFHTDTQ